MVVKFAGLSFIHDVHQINELISRGSGKVECGECAGTGICPECEGEGLLSFGVRGRARFSLVREQEGSSKALRVCLRCNSPVDPDPEAKYCWYCGAKLAEAV